MTDWRTEIYSTNLDFRRYSRGIMGNLSLEHLNPDGTWNSVLVIKKGWCADYVINQASGIPEVQIEIADQFTLADLMNGNGLQAAVVEGVRYEKRDQDLLVGVPKVWRLRCQPIGAEGETVIMQRSAQTSAKNYVQ